MAGTDLREKLLQTTAKTAFARTQEHQQLIDCCSIFPFDSQGSSQSISVPSEGDDLTQV